MTVAETTKLDSVAQAPDGRILLAMTEDRRYDQDDTGVLVEDFRQKLNAYVYVIRSGQLAQIIGRPVEAGAEIRLYSFDEPPAAVQEMIAVAASALAAENVLVTSAVHAPPSTDDLLGVIAGTLIARAPEGWTRIDLSASLVGNGLAGGLTATLPSGEVRQLQPDADLVQALRELKRSEWQPDRGSWLTFRAVIEDDRLQPSFDNGEPPGGAEQFPDAEWVEEYRRYPRADLPDWWRGRLG